MAAIWAWAVANWKKLGAVALTLLVAINQIWAIVPPETMATIMLMAGAVGITTLSMRASAAETVATQASARAAMAHEQAIAAHYQAVDAHSRLDCLPPAKPTPPAPSGT